MSASGSTPKAGDQVFLKLDEFSPSWRQALVVHVSSRNHLTLLVRVESAEIADQIEQVSLFETKGQKFLFVEGKKEQVRLSCPHPHRALEVNPKLLLEKGKEMISGGEVNYVTASEDLPAEPNRKEQEKQEVESSSDEMAASDSDGDEVMKLLLKAQKVKPDRATSSGSKRVEGSKKTRYPLLATKKEKKSNSMSGFEKLLDRAAAAGDQQDLAGPSLNTLVNLEVLKALRGQKLEKKMPDSDRSSVETSDQSSSDSSVGAKPKGAGKALRDFRHAHRRMRRRPLRHVKRYVKEVEANMGVSSQTPYSLSDYSKKLNWGKQKTLMRTHYALSELLQSLLQGKVEKASLQVVQLLRALHQVCLDQGSWRAASLLLMHADPLERPRFGGEPDQLEKIASYLRAMGDLEKRCQGGIREEEVPEKKGRGKGKARKGESPEDNANQ